MERIGIIAEWNPFHYGHRYLITSLRQKYPKATFVAVMSGNYTQRGEPAIVSKWHRAQAALANGVDLVLELPIWYATQPANDFAKGAISALAEWNLTHIGFGVEDASFGPFIELAKWEVANTHAISENFKASHDMDNTSSYMERWMQAIKQTSTYQENATVLEQLFDQNSNSLLAYTYVREMLKQSVTFDCLPIRREGANHRENHIHSVERFYSGSQIRQVLIENRDAVQGMVPETMYRALRSETNLGDWAALFPFLIHQVWTSSVQDLQSYYQMDEGMAYRFKDVSKTATSMATFVSQCRHRNWSKNRIQRAALMIVLGVTKKDMATYLNAEKQPLFILGFTERGKALLKHQRHQMKHWELIQRANRESELRWPLWLTSDRVYRQFVLAKADGDENFGRHPIRIEGDE